MKKYQITLFTIALVLPILACGSLTINNDSDIHASVKVDLPDDVSNIVVLSPNSIKTYFSFEGGPYIVQVFPSEVYITQMKAYEEKVIEFLLLGNLANVLNETDFPDDRYAFAALEVIQKKIESELSSSAVCGGTLNTELINGLFFLSAGGNIGTGENELQVDIFREGDKWNCE